MELIAGYSGVQIAVALAATFAAAFVRGLAGFGLAILMVPVLALALTPVEAVLVTNFIALCIGLVDLRSMRVHAERSALVIAGLVLVTTAPGLWALSVTPPSIARLVIAMVALSAFATVLFPVRPETVPGRAATGFVGVTSGLLTGFAGMPGPPVVPYYVGRAIPRHVAKASMVLIFSVAAFAGLASGTALGVLHWRLLGLAALLLPVVLVGNWVGTLAFGKVSDRLWRGFTGIVLALAAAAALFKLVQ